MPSDTNPPSDWRVDITEDGRSGSIVYRDSSGSYPFYWEYSGGSAIVSITASHQTSPAFQRLPDGPRRAEILQRVAAESIRQKAPNARPEIDFAAASIRLLSQGPARPSRPKRVDTFNRSLYYKLRLAIGLAIVAALGIVMLAKFLLSTAPTKAIPVSNSLRADNYIVTLVRSQEPYVPSLHRDPTKDRFQLFLLACHADGSPGGRLVEIGSEYRVSELGLARILGYDGRFVWCFADHLIGIDPSNGKSIRAKDLQRANPSFVEDWQDPRRLVFTDRLRVTSPDRQSIFEVEPHSLKALPAQPLSRANAFPFGPKLDDFLSVGARPAPTEWLALLSANQASLEYKPHSRLSRINRFSSSKEPRRFHRATLGPELDRGSREILEISSVSNESLLNAAFVRNAPDGEPIRLSEPDSFLVAYTSQPGLNGTLVLAKVTASGQILWKTDTGLDRFKLQQILPDPRLPAFVGPPLPIPNQVSHPLLAIIDTQTGALKSLPLAR